MSDQSGVRTSDGASSLAAVSALMEERRKFESWLTALEARRASTPERVFARVHADYSARLEGVVSELTTHAGGLRGELESLTARLVEVEDRQQELHDERAEAELRAHVGELSASAWEELAGRTDRSLEELAGRHSHLERELTRTRELVSEAERPATPRDAAVVPANRPASAPAPAPAPARASGAAPVADPAPPSSVAAAPPEEQPSDARAEQYRAFAPTREIAPEPSGSHARVDRGEAREQRTADESGIPAELPPSVIAAQAQLTPSEAGGERGDADVTPAPTQRADGGRERPRTGAFDELAFLSSVVDTPAGAVDVPAPADRADERTRRASFATRASDDIVNLSDDGSSALDAAAPARETPLAMNVTGNTPIIIRDKTAETAKSLKCSDCGAMNYPTEWYCERCGAELASL